MEKVEVQQSIFDEKIVEAMVPGMVQGVGRGGENLFSTHDLFTFFIFSDHQYYHQERFKTRQRQRSRSLALFQTLFHRPLGFFFFTFPPSPSVSLHDSDHAECCGGVSLSM